MGNETQSENDSEDEVSPVNMKNNILQVDPQDAFLIKKE